MELGIFAKTFARPTVEATLDAVAAHGLRCVQFNLSCAGRPTLPEVIEPELCERIAGAMGARGLRMAAVSGTFNMAHPDPAHRRDGLRRLGVLVAACPGLGTSIVTLCTGTRDPVDMWRRHPENDSAEAWRDLVESLRIALQSAEAAGVTLAVEPEPGNVIDGAPKARRLLDEVGSPRLKIVIDPANLPPDNTGLILDEAFALLGPDIVLAHAKDRDRHGAAGQVAPGAGVVDFGRYLSLLRRHAGAVSLILHGLDESQVAGGVAFLSKLVHLEE